MRSLPGINEEKWQTICVWPDEVWCYREELEGFLLIKSDDYSLNEVPFDFSNNDIDEYVMKLVKSWGDK